ncbi:DUF4393 domain-containing protein [Tenacibaculum finnmarkense]|uniref:DUF4393 domain-containing protein n=1 Tax=Tenacibaculum finnmarkense TaxID=2781243 RepID=UPI00187B456F|nr:DUF4393 domain-containing protein [Tenacibaculum finnmarkense]MBE7661543.1 DUF4393 domain-containing protein [Tenacibaculum finnmarkense genomovar finnmarkense]MCG8253269.1 DUF4393 domain-containing protein [Tenacibaculum finnmarkense genomovar finnmarkense]MCG8816781.1 DUF4393 domain-containing protein [Tenacibaculum finnmarkense]MCG8821768.1 DUF4393 domain-containing protein [Tenacibaculum finnmarkense]WCC44017.1 DUF4393 domain-containing protein [Tenacibaculum finnmarkense]
MSEESKINALVNIGQSKVVEKAYDDLLSEPSKKAGNALGTIVNLGNTMLWPIKWVNERTRLYFENNLTKYEQELDKIPEEKVTEVPTEISMPILERFTYTSNEELSNAFVKLLTSASSTESINKAHPGFIQVIDRLSPDEAILLKYISTIKGIPVLSIMHYNNPKNTNLYNYVLKNKTGLAQKVRKLKFPQNIEIYLNNLESLGIIKLKDYYITTIENDFQNIEKQFKNELSIIFDKYKEPNELSKAKKEEKGMYELTSYGKLFISACIETEKSA